MDVSSLLSDFRPAFDAWRSTLHSTLHSTSESHSIHCSTLQQRITFTHNSLTELTTRRSQILSIIDQEQKETNETRQQINLLNSTIQQLTLRRHQLSETATELNEFICRKQQEISLQKTRIQKQIDLNGPELLNYEKYLGLDVVGLGGDSLELRFRLGRRGKGKLVLNMAERKYKVLVCEPRVEVMDELLDELNEGRDFYGFLKKVRAEWVK